MTTLKYTAHVGADFLDHEGERHFCFQLCRTKPVQAHFTGHPNPAAHLEAHACAELDREGQVVRYYATTNLTRRKAAIVRLARRHHARLIPVLAGTH